MPDRIKCGEGSHPSTTILEAAPAARSSAPSSGLSGREAQGSTHDPHEPNRSLSRRVNCATNDAFDSAMFFVSFSTDV